MIANEIIMNHRRALAARFISQIGLTAKQNRCFVNCQTITTCLVVKSGGPMSSQDAVSDRYARLCTFGHDATAVAILSITFRIGQDNRARVTGRL